ncbi:MAG: phosphoenolpyruvate--protein phosphotransferase [Synergistaceae bacterium]|jgi:phosphotransferase system enzyme I (PtsI)|nr:phosphoenolpyruvate--protein phosphotransferase [Synergistaceae bacterium]
MRKGMGVSQGIAIGPAMVYKTRVIELTHRMITVNDVESEKKKAEAAIAGAKAELQNILDALDPKKDRAKCDLIEVQIELAADPMLQSKVNQYIEVSYRNVGDAVILAAEDIAKQFDGFCNEYYRARAVDIRDIGERLAAQAFGIKRASLARMETPSIVFAKDISPSETVMMDKEKVLAFVTELGSQTSHTAILAKMLEIPAVVGVSVEGVMDGERTMVDGATGEVLVLPSDAELATYEKRRKNFLDKRASLKKLRALSATTTDGYTVELCINIADPRETAKIKEAGADGVGLFRTEFLYMDAKELPGEEEQFNAYKMAAVSAEGRPVVIRTLDIGGDKTLPYLPIPQEANPFLGYRAIRLCLDRPDIFKAQLRAILRASAFGRLEIMFPMIGSMNQLYRAKQVVEECKKELAGQNIPFDAKIPVGMMVEIPSAAAAAQLFAKASDFFSIGTNDLCQYALAVDRMNVKISDLYNHFNPGVLRLIRNTIRAANEAGIMARMCGEMAADAAAAPLLLGMGLNEFSMNPASLPYIKDKVRGTSMARAKDIAEKAMEMDSAIDIQNYLEDLQ